MLNLVPIQFLAMFAYTILRVGVGIFWLILANRHYSWRNELITTKILFVPARLSVTMIIITEAIIGILLLLGLFTQVAAVLGLIWCLKMLLWRRYLGHHSFPSKDVLFLLVIISLTLFITGAGVLAFDLPI